MLKVAAVTATKNRHTHLERLVRFFLDQDYDNAVHIIYNNATAEQRFNTNVPEGKFILVNNHIDSVTGKPYDNLGAIYNDAITHIPEDVDVVCFFDDDDIFLPYHISEGVKGLERGGKSSYKPQKSYFKNGSKVTLMENVLEPSFFVKKHHILQYGFSRTTSDQHMQWLQPLINEGDVYVDPNGPPTLIYTWGNDIPTFKTSGNSKDPNNFKNYERFSRDKGDGIITPISTAEAQKYYQLY